MNKIGLQLRYISSFLMGAASTYAIILLVATLNPNNLNHVVLINNSEQDCSCRVKLSTNNRIAFDQVVELSSGAMEIFPIEYAWIDPIVSIEHRQKRSTTPVDTIGRFGHTLVIDISEAFEPLWLRSTKWTCKSALH